MSEKLAKKCSYSSSPSSYFCSHENGNVFQMEVTPGNSLPAKHSLIAII